MSCEGMPPNLAPMTTLMKTRCPGCGEASLSQPWVLPSQPVVLNYRFSTPEAAAGMPRTDMHLVECQACGLIFNASLDETAIPYDEHYDNRQGFSPAFVAHLEEIARHLVEHHPIREGVILEVGCGKGDFLKQVCRTSHSTGIGFDTSCETEGPGEDGTFFSKRYATEEDVPAKVNAILCRHVVEHVGEIGEFLALLHRMAVRGKADVVYLETPVWEWIVEQNAFWDIFHEHCNYFPAATLATLAERAGFKVLEHCMVFGGQYQALFLSPDRSGLAEAPPQVVPPTLHRFATHFQEAINAMKARIEALARPGSWGIWGAGAKGVSLTNHLLNLNPAFVVDANPEKCGRFIPGTSIPIVPPTSPRLQDATMILIANPNYLSEIRASLSHLENVPTLVPA